MLNPNETNRERLLRLIDGGAEALKEVQEERKPAADGKKMPTITPVTPKPSRPQARLDRDLMLRSAAAVAVVVLGFYVWPRLAGKPKAEAPEPAAQIAGVADENAGLRLVGVDWGEPPVALLEDLQTGKTYFARQEDKVKETRVKQIFKDKVLVAWRGKTLELR